MSLKQREKSDQVIDLTKAEYFAARPQPLSKFTLTLPDKLDLTPPPEERARYGDLGLAATLPIKRRRLRARFRDFDPLTILASSVVLTIGAVMLLVVATFRH